MQEFEKIRIHRSVAAGFGALFVGGLFAGALTGILWLIGEALSLAIFGPENETSA